MVTPSSCIGSPAGLPSTSLYLYANFVMRLSFRANGAANLPSRVPDSRSGPIHRSGAFDPPPAARPRRDLPLGPADIGLDVRPGDVFNPVLRLPLARSPLGSTGQPMVHSTATDDAGGT